MEAKEPFSVYILVRFDFPEDADRDSAVDEAFKALDTAGIESRFGHGIETNLSHVEPEGAVDDPNRDAEKDEDVIGSDEEDDILGDGHAP